MTVLTAETARKEFSWSAARLVVAALLLLLGISLLAYAWANKDARFIGIGVILAALGAAMSFERTAEAVMLPAAAVICSLIPFSIFVAFAGVNPLKVYLLINDGAFGSWFSFQNTLTRAAPLMLTGLCTALPLRIGMVIIGGEGAFIIGGLVAAGTAHALAGSSPWMILAGMLLAGFLAGGLWIMLCGALKFYRGVNETISSLLLIYIAVALLSFLSEGPWKDPNSLNKPSTWPVSPYEDGSMLLGLINFAGFEMDVHWGLAFGLAVCFLCWILMNQTVFGFAAQMVGGNVRAAKVAGLSLGKIILTTCLIAGGAAGLAGAIEVSAVQDSANSSLLVGYGYTGILVAFLARGNPLAIIPVAILLGGIGASGDLLQVELKLPNATVAVLQGMIFIVFLASESYYGKFKIFQKKEDRLG